MSALDQQIMAHAIALAKKGRYSVSPNPVVGCVIVKNDQIIGEGWHQRAGQAHAEVNALEQAGQQAKGATAYITLEPCSHKGRTPPCAGALIRCGISRVVYAMQDPNPQVSGRGLAKLVDAGIDVVGPMSESQARQLNRGFIKRHETGLPWVTLKMAASIDGRTAMESGESQWITGDAARRDVQRLRAASCAIITGIDTLLTDDAKLTVRLEELGDDARQPLRVVLDSNGRLPPGAALLHSGGDVLQVVANVADSFLVDQSDRLQRICLPAEQGVDLTALLKELAARQCNNLLVEAGAKLAGSFIQAGLVDELVLYMAPTLMGSKARPLFTLPLDKMDQQRRLKLQDIRSVGDDLRMTYTLQQAGDN